MKGKAVVCAQAFWKRGASFEGSTPLLHNICRLSSSFTQPWAASPHSLVALPPLHPQSYEPWSPFDERKATLQETKSLTLSPPLSWDAMSQSHHLKVRQAREVGIPRTHTSLNILATHASALVPMASITVGGSRAMGGITTVGGRTTVGGTTTSKTMISLSPFRSFASAPPSTAQSSSSTGKQRRVPLAVSLGFKPKIGAPGPKLARSFENVTRRDNRKELGYSVIHPSSVSEAASTEDTGEGVAALSVEEVVGPSLGVRLEVEAKPVFAVVQIGSHQFKVTPGDIIYTEKLLFADVNDQVRLEKVLMLGSRSETVVGRPMVPDAHVFALVEEQAQDAKVIVFKKKRRKNYRRHQGHRQQLTRLRILDVVGIEASPP